MSMYDALSVICGAIVGLMLAGLVWAVFVQPFINRRDRGDHLTVGAAVRFLWHLKRQGHYDRIEYDAERRVAYCTCGGWSG